MIFLLYSNSKHQLDTILESFHLHLLFIAFKQRRAFQLTFLLNLFITFYTLFSADMLASSFSFCPFLKFQLQDEAAMALACLEKCSNGGFEEVFMTKIDFAVRYDHCIRYRPQLFYICFFPLHFCTLWMVSVIDFHCSCLTMGIYVKARFRFALHHVLSLFL